jgi:hypothetical protein
MTRAGPSLGEHWMRHVPGVGSATPVEEGVDDVGDVFVLQRHRVRAAPQRRGRITVPEPRLDPEDLALADDPGADAVTQSV